ncbi:YjiH family protein [Salisediminibacterium halotolerans]|uniref:Nucleoside recognition GATE domain-containing membrane protein YjiH n=1 Tax=Salisediminibacterium halotolerans TaxID=517425 RepID=A0A1H9WC86_9BACI|nr:MULTISPECIES: YjiH family protein [Salisediminibacterium]RLJ79347.1 nucleoside recognition membrane protein YjiH [Actinophytocola xinjiangensis]RPE83403.1 nucleoside recognition membrane protein YjiH [Salisediminibacterium halotolerans]TWG37789.1 nucleoside recognition membrane protein YjiH [Salisediminibacterium halotolerans]SES31445.1 nucleoside recognition GATE domain-containing membrane protein YjiH [Salisediminibacterium haloalkalitolerans]GEL09150.1 membrane protein [Salisediminibacte
MAQNTETAAQQSIPASGEASYPFLKFLLPSLFGVLLFLIPVPFDGGVTIGVGILAESLQSVFAGVIPAFMTAIIFLSAAGSIAAKTVKPAWITESPALNNLFNVSAPWLVIRVAGFIFAAMTLTAAGPGLITSEVTGGTVLNELIPVLMTWFLFAALFMPFLLSFGLMDFIGTLLRKFMQPAFKLPGRSAIDATASWMGAGPVGVLITTQQFEQGYYTKRESSVIATNFSIASIAFSLVIIGFIGLEQYFIPFYFTVTAAVFIAAVIMPRIPPLSLKKDDYYEPAGKQISEAAPENESAFSYGLKVAVEKANRVKSIKSVLQKGAVNVMDMWFGLLPIVMTLGTLALILAEFTNVFVWLSAPIVPLLQLLGLPEAHAAAPAMIVGFADMFLPAVIGSGIESEMTRFVIAGVSIAQLVYMSEIGVLIIRSQIPLRFWELAVIFIQRTLITLPIITLAAHFIF